MGSHCGILRCSEAVSRRFPTAEAQVRSQEHTCAISCDNVTMEQISLAVFRCLLSL